MPGLHRLITGNKHSTQLLAFLIACCTCISVPNRALAADTEKVLTSFSGNDGANPQAGLIFDPSGNLYGTTIAGGGSSNCTALGAGCGTVFQLSPGANGSWTMKILHYFSGGIDGANPASTLIFDAVGNLYGT